MRAIPSVPRPVQVQAGLAFLLAACIAGCLLIEGGCSRTQYGIQIKGSDTMVNLCQAWSERFMALHPDVPVAVTGGGSGTGISSLVNGTCQIAASSRVMEPEEIEAAEHVGVHPVEHTVGLDGIAVIVSPANPVSRLTMAQLRDIFTGRITNWQEVGGPNKPIVVLSREVNSGTHVYFKEHVLAHGSEHEEFTQKALLMASSQALADEVSQNESAIGYFGMAYLSPKQKGIAIASEPGAPFIPPTLEAVRSGQYAIARPLLFYTNGEPKGDVKLFMEFAFSAEGQKIVAEQGFVPVG